jgi:cellulose synthase/poly-beta-1,6-N-acetylglucosamine synthase-like glycosyltransferase
VERQSSKTRTAAGVRVVAVLPAHNEEENLPVAVASLRRQTRPVDRILVLADNCTDGSAELAEGLGCDVHTTVANSAKKAGALNQALPGLLDSLEPDDVVLVMDADSSLGDEFVETALDRLAADPRLGAVGGVFYGLDGHGLVGQLQRNEYVRYAREISRRQARAVVLTGTGSAFRVEALRRVAAGRGLELPGRPGDVYDTTALTEDNEMTLALKTLGYACLSPRECRVSTEIMPGAKELWRQRLRWQRGALDNLRHYGWNRVTRTYIFKQAFMYAGALMMVLYLGLTALAVSAGAVTLTPFWLAIGGIFVLERLVTVRAAGPRGIAVALTVVLEFGYDLFQMAVYVVAAWNHLLGREARWHHVGEEVTT